VSGPDKKDAHPAQAHLRRFKEKLAERLWALPGVSESEKELVFRAYLADLDDLERDLAAAHEEASSRAKSSADENELLRSLMGVPGDELRTRVLTLGEDVRDARERLGRREEEVEEIRTRFNEAMEENEILRKRVREFEQQADVFRAQQLRVREDDIRFYSETHEALRNQLGDLETRLSNLRELFADSNKKLATDKQEEISLLQKKLLDEMEITLRRRQELAWAEEESFAKGVANRVRTALVSAQGQLLLTLERLGVLEPDTKTEAFWKGRLRLLVDGAGEIAKNFREIQALLAEVTSALDDYLHLTRRREIAREPVALADLARRELSSLYADRQPTLNIDVMADDPLPDVTGDASLISFVVRELVRNAVESLPNGAGSVFIQIKNVRETGVVRMLVKDSGKGIPKDVRARLFQPFFSTKANRQGLSLSRAKRYAEFHGGDLTLIESSPSGTLFQLELPVAGKAERPAFSPMSMRRPDPSEAA
jgi:signal transduction histidine kinase